MVPTGCVRLFLMRLTCRWAAVFPKLADRVFRIGHLGDFNDLMLAGTLAGVEMELELAGVPHRAGGVGAALSHLAAEAAASSDRRRKAA